MKKLKLITVVGTRPEIIRLSRSINSFDNNLNENRSKYFIILFKLNIDIIVNYRSLYRQLNFILYLIYLIFKLNHKHHNPQCRNSPKNQVA